MNARTPRRRSAREITHVIEISGRGMEVKDAGAQLAGLVGQQFLALVREQQRIAKAAVMPRAGAA